VLHECDNAVFERHCALCEILHGYGLLVKHTYNEIADHIQDGRWKNAVNMLNPLGTKGSLAGAFAQILYEMSHSELPHLNPSGFRVRLSSHQSNRALELLSPHRNRYVITRPSLAVQTSMIRKSF
jgi:hypothetical protein